MVGFDEAQGAGPEDQDDHGEGLALLPGRVEDGPDLAHRPEEVQSEVEPVHAGVGLVPEKRRNR